MYMYMNMYVAMIHIHVHVYESQLLARCMMQFRDQVRSLGLTNSYCSLNTISMASDHKLGYN